MNKVYKLKYNAKKQLQVVSEIATKAGPGSTATTATTETEKLSFNPLVSNSMVAGLTAGLAVATVGMAQADLGRAGMEVVSGAATAIANGAVTTITNSHNAIINWQKFNINENEIVKFIQQSTDSAVLNRVLGGELTKILGTLQSNGKVFIVNPAGIVFGEKSVVDVASLVASTLDITDEDFLSGNYVFNQEKDQAIAQVLSQGMIKVNDDGTLALVGGKVVNTGVLEAKNGSVYLLAGQSITIQDLDNPLISYKVSAENKAVNLGQIVSKRATLLGNKVANGYTSSNEFADVVSGYATSATNAVINADGEIVLFGASEANELQTTAQTNLEVKGVRNSVVSNTGTLDVSNPTGKAGKIKVLGDKVEVGSTAVIDASGEVGGEVLLGGDHLGKGSVKLSTDTKVEAGAKVNASAEKEAGSIYVWGDNARVEGEFLATSETSYGGVIETSGKTLETPFDNFFVSTASQAGREYYGTYIIDPDRIFIAKDNRAINTLRSTYGRGGTPYTESQINNLLRNSNIDTYGTLGVYISGVNISSSKGSGRFAVYSTGGKALIENSTINLNGWDFVVYGQTGMTINGSTINVRQYTIGTGDKNSYYSTRNADKLNIGLTVSDSTITSASGSYNFIRANAWGGLTFKNTNLNTVGGTIDLQSNADNNWDNLNVKAGNFVIYEQSSNKDTITSNIKNSNFDVSGRWLLQNKNSKLILDNTSLNTGVYGFETNDITVQNSRGIAKTINFRAKSGNLLVKDSNFKTNSQTSLLSDVGDVNYQNTTLDIGSGSLTVSAGNNATLTNSKSELNLILNDDANVHVHGGNTAKVDSVSLKAQNVSVTGGVVKVKASNFDAANVNLSAVERLEAADNTLKGLDSVTLSSDNSDVLVVDNRIITDGDLSVSSNKNVEIFGGKAEYTLGENSNLNVRAGETARIGNFDVSINSINVAGNDVVLTDNDFQLKEEFVVDVENTAKLVNTSVQVDTGRIAIDAKKGLEILENSKLQGTTVSVSSSEGEATISNATLVGTQGEVDVNATSVALKDVRIKGVNAVNLTATKGDFSSERVIKTDAANLNVKGKNLIFKDSRYSGNDTGYATLTYTDSLSTVNTTFRRYIRDYETGTGLYQWNSGAETDNSDVAYKDGYATGTGLYQWNSGAETENPDVAYQDGYATGTGLYQWNSGAETTNPDVAYKEGHKTGDALTQDEYETGTGLYQWNSGAETQNPDVAHKDSYATGTGLYQWNSGEETTNPDVANKDSYATGTGLYQWNSGAETQNPDVANKDS
ncbi:hypothetical protein CKF54_06360 [Psittacicella hinzii]|uniref:Filamentous haemagglutinin FhaB/tRNA nuclease CdiA-like TPS domain-containing protein n=1 Tax=Psittacicella hinzii TaxID=2028575 RepID=A0A3A1Y2V8_9GAMM|nr:filamentous hemagglutinin N-terminal domain-containing protein [Psittacicella hinzii]RIY31619.1 hypothetical protein CKF54_06360 [Psittacicella hinzii]